MLFAGELNTGSQSISLSYTNGAISTLDGFSIVGNPYPSSINWDTSSGWTKNNVDNAIYFWNQTGYLSYVNGAGTGGKYIGPGQGFFVHATAATTLQMTNAVRTHASASTFRSNLDNMLKLKIENDSMSDEAIIRFIPDASLNFDGNYDAYKLFGYKPYPQLYSLTENGVLASINSLPLNNDSTKVKLNLNIGTSGNYKITANGIESFNYTNYIALEDLKTNTTQILTTNPVYSFYGDTADKANRFIVWFYEKPNAIADPPQEMVDIFSNNNSVIVDLKGMNHTNSEISILNLLGQTVYKTKITSNHQSSYNTNLSAGMYIVRLFVNGQWYDKKLYLDE